MVEHDVKGGGPGAADPIPLGFAAFALAAFALGVSKIGLATDTTWVGPAIIAAGLAQFVAGMWAFRNRTTFWATMFSTYGVFWLALGGYFLLQTFGKVSSTDVASSLGFLLLAVVFFNASTIVWSARLNVAAFGVFLSLEVTAIVLSLGSFSSSDFLIRLGGWLGILTALIAWYVSAAGVLNTMGARPLLWTGTPIWTESSVTERERTPARR